MFLDLGFDEEPSSPVEGAGAGAPNKPLAAGAGAPKRPPAGAVLPNNPPAAAGAGAGVPNNPPVAGAGAKQ